MKGHTGELLFALQIGVLLAAIASWLVASAYRRRMLALMRGGAAPAASAAPEPSRTASRRQTPARWRAQESTYRRQPPRPSTRHDDCPGRRSACLSR